MQPVGVDHAGLGRSCQSAQYLLIQKRLKRSCRTSGATRVGRRARALSLREYTRWLPIDNLQRARHDLEDGGRAARKLAVGFDPDRLIAVDLHPSALGELHLLEPATRAPGQHP